MVTVETLAGEGPRYTAPMVCLPALWAGPASWRSAGALLAHRGWDCHLVDIRGVPGGVAARAAAVGAYAETLGAPPVLVGHDGGALVALATAARTPLAALVLVAPLHARRAVGLGARGMLALVLGRPVPPPTASHWLDLPASAAASVRAGLGPEDARAVRETLWGRGAAEAVLSVPTLVVAGTHDRLLPPSAASTVARALGAEFACVEDAGHWLLAGAAWQATVRLVHRWLVQALGESLLDRYAEAMAERAVDESDEE
jgi:pimeloyl-ACP methyl ester carboxylesterase